MRPSHLLGLALALPLLASCDDAGFNSTTGKKSAADKKAVETKDAGKDEDESKDPGGATSKPLTQGTGLSASSPLLLPVGVKTSVCEKLGIATAGAGSKSSASDKATFDAASCVVTGVEPGEARITVDGPDGPKDLFVKIVDPSAMPEAGATGDGVAAQDSDVSEGDGAVQANAAAKPASDLVCSDKKYNIDGKCVDSIPIHRWFSAKTGDHFFTPTAGAGCAGKTSAAAECGGELVNEGQYVYEGVGFWSLPLSEPPHPQLTKFFRLFAGGNGDHFYTIDQAEATAAAQHGYTLEGFYQVFGSQQPFTKPIHRWFNPSNGDHHYTFSAGPSCAGKTSAAAECGGETVNEGGWRYEGTAGFLFPG